MTLEEPLRQVQTALNELNRVAQSTQGWADQQRRDFDSHRLKPLNDAGTRLTAALQKAQEQCGAAARLLDQR